MDGHEDDLVEQAQEIELTEVTDAEFAGIAAEALRCGVNANQMPIAFNGSNEQLKLWAKQQNLPSTMRERIAFWLRAAILVEKEKPLTPQA